MAKYHYAHSIFRDLNDVVGAEAGNDSNKTDYETNFKSSVVEVDEIIFGETVFRVNKNYAGFKALIDGTTITWGQVKTITTPKVYTLNLVTENPL